MKTTLKFSDFTKAFRDYGRENQFSFEGLSLIYDYITEYERESGEEVELDVIGICCDWSEDSPEELVRAYDIDLGPALQDPEALPLVVFEFMNDETIVAGVTSKGTIVYVQF